LDNKKRVYFGYEETHAVKLGSKEFVLAEDKNDEARYAVFDFVLNDMTGKIKVKNTFRSADFVEAMKEFAHRLTDESLKIEVKREQRGIPTQILADDECIPIKAENLKSSVVVIKSDSLPPEHRTIDYQLALCTSDFSTNPNEKDGSVFCQNLISGKKEKFSRDDIAGIADEGALPEWAKGNLEVFRKTIEKTSEFITAEPLSKEQFWEIIDYARETAGGWKDMLEPLVDTLSQLDTPNIIRWKQIFDEYQNLAYKEKLWAAATFMNGGCSDDGFMDFRGWLTAQGKDVFLKALENPDTLAQLEAVQKLAAESHGLKYMPDKGFENWAYFENVIYSASYAYERRLGKDADIYEMLKTSPLSEQEKVDIASEVKYAADIDTETWRGGATWLSLVRKMEGILPNLHKTFTDTASATLEANAVHKSTKSEKTSGNAAHEKESVLDQIKQDKQSKNSTKEQPKKEATKDPKSKKSKKTEPEH